MYVCDRPVRWSPAVGFAGDECVGETSMQHFPLESLLVLDRRCSMEQHPYGQADACSPPALANISKLTSFLHR
jgi:hypothetical protein